MRALAVSILGDSCDATVAPLRVYDQRRHDSGGGNVSGLKIVALLLILGGILGLVYGGFTYTKATHDAKLGPIEFSVKEKERVNVPMWAGVGAIVAGALILLVPAKR